MNRKLDYKNLRIWKKSLELVKAVYAFTNNLPKSEEYILKQQLKRAAISVSVNIAEGKSRGSKRDFARFIDIAFASLLEVEALLIISVELGFSSQENLEKLFILIKKLSMQMNALKSRLKN
jgi:four helix bundle protein